MKLLRSLFFVTTLVAIVNAYGVITLSRNNELGLSVLNVDQTNVRYQFGIDVPVDVITGSVFMITFPFQVGTISQSGCVVATGNTKIGTQFDPAAGFDSSSATTQYSVTQCFSSSTMDQIVQIQVAEVIPAGTSLNISITIPNAAPTSLTYSYISFEITSYNGTDRYVYASQQNLVAIAYQSVPTALTGTLTATMNARNKYENAIDYLLKSSFVTIESVFANKVVTFYDDLVLYQLVADQITHYQTLYPDDADFDAQVAPLVTSDLTSGQCGFEGTLKLLFTTGTTALRSLMMVDITLPEGWTASNSTYCYVCSDNGEQFLKQTECKLIGTQYLYLLVRDEIPASSSICLAVTHIKNPLYVVSTPQSVMVRILDTDFHTVVYAKSFGSLTTTAPTLKSFTMVQGNRIADVIFRNAYQYVGFQISSYAGISASSLIRVTTSPSSSRGFIKGTCVVTKTFVPKNSNPVACIVTASGTIELTNYAAIAADTVVEFRVLLRTEDAASQSFTASIYSYNSDGTVRSAADASSTSSFTYQSQDFTLSVLTGDSCGDFLDSSLESNRLCFQATGLTTGASSSLKINTHPFVTPIGFSPVCHTGSGWGTQTTGTCSITAGDASFFIGASPSQVPTVIQIDSDDDDAGYYSIDGLYYDNLQGGTNLNTMMLEFVAIYTVSSTTKYAYVRTDINPPTPEWLSLSAYAINIANDTDIKASVLVVEAEVYAPYIPLNVGINPSLVIYFNPAKFSFTNFADYNAGEYASYPITFSYSSFGEPKCKLVKGDTNGPNYHSWHRITVNGLVNFDYVQIYLPFEQATFANNDIIVEARGYDDLYSTSFPYSMVNMSYPSAPATSVATLSAGSFDFTTETYTLGANTWEIDFNYDTTGVPSTDFSGSSTPEIPAAFVGYFPWIVQNADVDEYSIYSEYLSEVIFINYTTTAGTITSQSLLVMLQDVEVAADESSDFDIVNLMLPNSTSIPAYWIYLTCTDGSTIGKRQEAQQTDLLTAGEFWDILIVNPLPELSDYYYESFYFFHFDPNAYYIVRIFSPIDIKENYGIVLTLPTDEYPGDQQAQTFTCYLVLRDSETYGLYDEFDLSTLNYYPGASSKSYGNAISITCSAQSASSIYAVIPQAIPMEGLFEVHIIGIQNPTDDEVTEATLTVAIVDDSMVTLAQGEAWVEFTTYESSYDSNYIDDWWNWLDADNDFDNIFINGYGRLAFELWTDYIFWGNEEIFISMGNNFHSANSANDKMDCEVDVLDDWNAYIYPMYFDWYSYDSDEDYWDESDEERRRRVLQDEDTSDDSEYDSEEDYYSDGSYSDSEYYDYYEEDEEDEVVYPKPGLKTCTYDTTRKGFSIKFLTPTYKRGHILINLYSVLYPTTFGGDITLNILQGNKALITELTYDGTWLDPETTGTILSSGVTMSVFPNTIFDLGIYTFTFQIPDEFTVGGKIWLRYPPDFMISDTPQCTINSSPVLCSYSTETDSIEIFGISSPISANTNIVLVIHGFQNPSSSTNKFSIQLSAQEYIADDIYYYHQAGVSSFGTNPADKILIYSITPSSNTTGTLINLAFEFTVSAATSSGDILYILLDNFPKISSSLTTCSISDGTTDTDLTCDTKSKFITVDLGTLTLTTTNTYTLSIGPLRSPYNPGQMGRVTFTLVNSGETTVKQKSYASYYGYTMPVFRSEKKYLRIWQDGVEALSYPYYIGTRSHPFYFNTSDGLNYGDTLTIQITSTGISGLQIAPSILTLALGGEVQGFTIGVESGTGSGELSFTITSSSGNIYETPPSIEIVLTNVPTIINTPTLLNVTAGANSFFYQISCDYPPLTDITLQLASSDTSAITIVYPPDSTSNTLTFTSTSYTANIQIAATDSASTSDTYTIELTIGGTNADSYYLDDTKIAIQLNDTIADLTASYNVTSVKSTQVSFNVTTSWSCVLFYQATPSTQTTSTGAQVLALLNSKNALTYNDLSTYSSYGLFNIFSDVTNASYTITGLSPETDYKITFFPYHLDGTFLTSKTFTVKTTETERPYILAFGSPAANMSNETYNYFACSLCSYLSIPVSRLTSPNRPLCDMASYLAQKATRRLLSDEGTALSNLEIDKSLSDSTTQILAAQATTIQQLLGVDPSQLSMIDPTHLANTITYANELEDLSMVQFTTNINFYVLSNKSSNVNDVASLVSRIDNNAKLAYFYSVMGITDRYYLKQTGRMGGSNAISTIIPSFNKKGVLLRGQNYFVLQAELNLEGMIYAVALPINSTTPTAAQIAQGLDSKGAAALAAGYNTSTYSSDGNLNPVRVTLANLTAGTSYDVYYVPALQIPGDIKIGSNVFRTQGKIAANSSGSSTTSSLRLSCFGGLITLITLLMLTVL